MPHDEVLADRIRDLLGPDAGDERRMFGGLAFLVGGHMAVAISGEGGIMVRCEPAESEALLEEPGATRMVMANRELAGWLRVSVGAVADDEALARWVGIGTTYAAGLPPK